ncbi:hypothetical protein BHE74_00039846, partial [Ensete ventricosum]
SWASIPYQHNLRYAPLVPNNSNGNTVAYSSRVPASASSCPVLRSPDPNFTSESSWMLALLNDSFPYISVSVSPKRYRTNTDNMLVHRYRPVKDYKICLQQPAEKKYKSVHKVNIRE